MPMMHANSITWHGLGRRLDDFAKQNHIVINMDLEVRDQNMHLSISIIHVIPIHTIINENGDLCIQNWDMTETRSLAMKFVGLNAVYPE